MMRGGALYLLAAATRRSAVATDGASQPRVRVGLVTDLHYADKPTRGTRHYRDTPAKLAEAARQFTVDKPDFVVELGDLIDAAESVDVELGYLRTVAAQFNAITAPKHYVLGNHCVDTLTKREFLDGVGQAKSYYSFDVGGRHFVVLDACFRSDGVPYGRKNSTWSDAHVPADELEWLKADLAAAVGNVIVFAHQRLDEGGKHAVGNAAAVRQVLEASGKVLAVLQGHSHRNEHQEIGGIHYATLAAMVEGAAPDANGYSVLDVLADDTLRLTGFRKQTNYAWQRG